MSNETKKTALPKLRFPEFEEAGEWEEKRVGGALTFQTGFPFDSAGFNDEGNGIRLIKNRDLKADDRIAYYSKPFDEKFIVNNGDVLVGMDGDFTPCVWNKGKALLNQRVGRVLAKTPNDQGFLYHFLTIHLKAIEEVTARTTVKHLSHSNIEKLHAPIPLSGEQQKIAATLSSLDDLITAQNAKLAALQAHKRGLMQGLFPAEGETVPKLRFPEFQEAGEWKRVKLSTQVELISGLHLSPDGYAAQGDIPYFSGPSDFTNDLPQVSKWTLQSTNIGRVGDTLITVKGSGAGGLFQLIIEEVALGRQLMAVRAIAAHAGFISHFLATQKQRLESLATGNLIPGLSRVDILGLNVMIPLSAEQQKVAATLTSLDNRITAQIQKIEALKLHKKGLMQNLFPAAAEPTV